VIYQHCGKYYLFSSILVLLESCLQTCMTYSIAECTVNKLLMMDRGTVRNVDLFQITNLMRNSFIL